MQSPCIVGLSCRLPGGVARADEVWEALCSDDWVQRNTPSPPSQNIANDSEGGRGGWLGAEGFDASFFDVSPAEATSLHPNIRLALELTWEALENAGIPPSSLRGKNISVSFAVGTENGDALKQHQNLGNDLNNTADCISSFFDFKGPTITIPNAHARDIFALKNGINSLTTDASELAVVGAINTHFDPALSMTEVSGRASVNSCPTSEAAVVFVVKKFQDAVEAGDRVDGVIRSFSVAHTGGNSASQMPSVHDQVALSRRALRAAQVQPDDIHFVQTNDPRMVDGVGGEVDAIVSVYKERLKETPLYTSSSELFGHYHGAAAFVGILKAFSFLNSRSIPPYHDPVKESFLQGPVQIPVNRTPLSPTGDLFAQVNIFGSTGSSAAAILQSSPERCLLPYDSTDMSQKYLLCFSAKEKESLPAQIRTICSWAIQKCCNLPDLSAALALCREHFSFRQAVVVTSRDDLSTLCGEFDMGAVEAWPPGVEELAADGRLDARLLNLEDPRLHSRVPPEELNIVNSLLDQGHATEAARLLYNRGHQLAFSKVYDKRRISPDVIQSLPFYQFSRKLYRKGCSSQLPRQVRSKESLVDQEMFESLIEMYGTPFPIPSPYHKMQSDIPPSHILLTGANGMLGTLLLSRLLGSHLYTIHCIIRGDPLARLIHSFEKYGRDAQLIRASLERGSLRLYKTTALSDDDLGVRRDVYAMLVGCVDIVIHVAWTVNFNLPLREFMPLLKATRSLAQLCVESQKRVVYHFVSTYASAFNFPAESVPESAVEPKLSYSLAQGYAISKSIAEHALLRIHAAHRSSFHLVIQRLGQLCGDTSIGSWNPDEMIPMLIAALPTLGALPSFLPNVSWIPSDVCAGALLDVIGKSGAMLDPAFLHIANPVISPWEKIAAEIAKILGIQSFSLLPLREYVDRLQRTNVPLSIQRLLPFFVSSLESGTTPQRYASLNVTETIKLVPSLKSCPLITGDFLRKIVESIFTDPTLPKQVRLCFKPPIFVFGPWSAIGKSKNFSRSLIPIKQRLDNLVHKTRIELGDDVNYADSVLDEQVRTLAAHLSTVSKLAEYNIRPRAVVGYCFGEYSAGIVAGALTEEDVINVLVRRAIVLRTVDGQMLNVFCDLVQIKRLLACMAAAPDVAIHVGPTHFVLSGSCTEIGESKQIFDNQNIKTILINSRIPFHSHLMERPLLQMNTHIYNPSSASIPIVSALASDVVKGDKLGFKYWQRHMRVTFRFYEAMQCARLRFPEADILDIGPGSETTRIIKRYGWTDVSVLSLDDILEPGMDGMEDASQASGRALSADALSKATPESPQLPLQIIEQGAVDSLAEMFGYSPTPALLNSSLHALGLHSLDFIRFSKAFQTRTGVSLNLSVYTSDSSLKQLIAEAVGSSNVQ
ncbi:hypothetical protein AX17_003796 [Amanita inopinata Kibby_2008]|nr:hypothetical protein AX17_003796 [Amanita inopinata Kibby_2008]